MSEQHNAIATRRDAYVETINEAYAQNYGKWLDNQAEKTRERIRSRAKYIKHGLSIIAPVQCFGPQKCPFFHACPIPEDPRKPGPDSLYPINMPCVLEVEYMAQQVVSYVEQLKVDPFDPVEMSLVNELALLDLLKNRAVLVLSGGDARGQGRDLMIVEDTLLGFDRAGNPHLGTSTRVHPALDVLERHEKRRLKILEKFNATRESKFKVFGNSLDTQNKLATDIAQLRGFIENLSKAGVVINTEADEVIYLDEPKSPDQEEVNVQI